MHDTRSGMLWDGWGVLIVQRGTQAYMPSDFHVNNTRVKRHIANQKSGLHSAW